MKKIILFAVFLFSLVTFVYAETELPLTATASSSLSSSYPPAKAVDKNLSTYWWGKSSSVPWWLMLDCGNSYSLSKISIWWHKSYGASDYNILSSLDGNTWTNLYTGLSSSGSATNPYLVTYSLSTTARYIRIYINKGQSIYPRIYEVELYAATANQPPQAQAEANSTSGTAPLTVNFTGTGTDSDGTITGYSWNFGDGATSTQQNPAHTYNSAGTYTATLTVTDNSGATGTANLTITVSATSVAIPHLMRFQARLQDAQGNPLNGSFDLTFKLYNSATGGSPLWQELQQDKSVAEGSLDLELGSVTQLNLPFDQQYWLGVKVEADAEMTPRFKLTTAPYSFRSEK